jgi:predicted nucleic acid-binding protein
MIVVKILTEILKPLERVAGVLFQRTDQTQGALSETINIGHFRRHIKINSSKLRL